MWITQQSLKPRGYRDFLRLASPCAMGVNRALWLYAFLVAAITLGSWAVYWHTGDALTRPVFAASNQYKDLTLYAAKTARLHGGAEILGSTYPPFNYPAPAAFVYKAFLYSLPGHQLFPYFAFLTICMMAFCIVVWRAAGFPRRCRWPLAVALATTAVGYPLFYCAYLANIEIVVWALTAIGLCFLLKKKYLAAGLLIGLAVSVKPFVFLFLLLLVRQRRYKEAAAGAATACMTILIALTVLNPNPVKAYQFLRPSLKVYVDQYVRNIRPIDEQRFIHSPLDAAKSLSEIRKAHGLHPHQSVVLIERWIAEPDGWPAARHLAKWYPLFVAISLVALLVAFYKLPLLNQLTALGVAVTMFPPEAGDYTLLHLYIPFAALLIFLVREGAAKIPAGSMVALFVIYAFLFAPLTPLMIYAGDAKLLFLIALLVVTARTPMQSTSWADSIP